MAKPKKITKGIIHARDIWEPAGYPSHQAWIAAISRQYVKKGMIEVGFSGKVQGAPVEAVLSTGGRWSVFCPFCSYPDPNHPEATVVQSSEYVDLDEAIFFCFNCSNLDGHARPVSFPTDKERLEIEQIVMSFPIVDKRGPNKLVRAFTSVPVYAGLERRWLGEPLAEMRVKKSILQSHLDKAKEK